MEKLEEAGLYGKGLVTINTPEMIERYNASLHALGIAPTTLDNFRIDGVGWSPEVAAEKQDEFYLSHGPACPLGVILTPDQYNKPIYVPYFSFQRQLMREHFQQFAREIADLTTRVGLHLELEHGISQHRSPLDLLLLQNSTVRTGGATEVVQAFYHQRSLIDRFNASSDAWFDSNLRTAIIESARTHGDLRARNFHIPQWHFTKTEFFHARDFGGVFVFRGLKTFNQVLIYEDPQIELPPPPGRVAVFELANTGWLTVLMRENLVGISRENPAIHLGDLRRIKEAMLARAACDADPQLDFTNLTTAQRKGLANSLKAQLGETYFDLERAEIALERAPRGTNVDLGPHVERLICQPATQLPPEKQKALRQLLSKSRTVDIWPLYRYNKHYFYDEYSRWNPAMQKWAVQHILSRIKERQRNQVKGAT